MLSDSQRRRRTLSLARRILPMLVHLGVWCFETPKCVTSSSREQIPGQIHTLLFAEYVLFYHATISNQYEYADSIITIIPRKRCH